MRTDCLTQGSRLSAMWCALNVKEIQKRGDICIHTADWLCSTAKTNTTL